MKTKNNQTLQSHSAISISNFSKRYAKKSEWAAKNISLEVKEGEFHGFIGANGAGKTTTIKAIIGAYSRKKHEGQILIFGFDNDSDKAKKLIGYISEKDAFPSNLSSFCYLQQLAYIDGASWKESKKLALATLEEVGLTVFANKNPRTFSSGQKKKLLLAQAILRKPKLLIMDEPTANLDPQTRDNFYGILKKYHAQGMTIFISSHALEEIEALLTHVSVVEKGKVVYSGPLKDFGNNKDHNHKIYCIKFESQVPKILEKYLNENKVTYKIDNNILEFEVKENDDLLKINRFIVQENIAFVSINQKIESLSDRYLNLVNK